MPSFSFIHTADLHLESPFSSLSRENSDIASAMRSATFEAFENIIRLCIDKGVDFLLIAGDVYDGEDRSLRAQVKFRDGLKKLHDAGIEAYVVHGNHDPLNVWSSSLEWPPGVHLFGDHVENREVRRNNETLAFIQGISYPVKEERRNLASLFKRSNQEFHIGLLHANVGSDTGHEPYAPCSLEDLRRPEMDYWALGHVHNRRILSLDRPYILYPGNTQGRNIRENGERGCYLVRVSEDGHIDAEFQETDVIRWEIRELEISNMDTEQELVESLEKTCRDISQNAFPRSSIVRIFLTGSGPLVKILKEHNTMPDLQEMVRETGTAMSPFVWVEQVRDMTTPVPDLSSLKKREGFIGELLDSSNELVRDGSLGDFVKDELSPLFDYSRFRRFFDYPGKEKQEEILKRAEMLCIRDLYEGEKDKS